MRLGATLFCDFSTPEKWIAALKELGYTAAYCPVGDDSTEEQMRSYAKAAEKAGIVISEVGAWSNPLAADAEVRRKAMARMTLRLARAESVGARCCVNISGSRGEPWDGPHPLNLTDETFDMTVASVREVIDAVKPKRTFYTLETMPWMYPDSPDSYLRLIKAIDRKQFAVHFDPANLICSPQRYFASGDVIREFVTKLGRYIRSCHGKDVLLGGAMTTHIQELQPGLGALDYKAFLTEIARLDPDTPLMLEHLKTKEEYDAATTYVRAQAAAAKVKFI